MTDKKTIPSTLLTNLELSGLEGCNFITLREVYSLTAIPVKKGNIPLQEDLEWWPHLEQVQIPHLDAEIDLLIGINMPKAMEPKEN